MTRTTKNISSSDQVPSLPSKLEQQVTGMSTVMHNLLTRPNNTESRVEQLNIQFTQFMAQHASVPNILQQLIDEVD
jgi:environmental stress-induced protein Ves